MPDETAVAPTSNRSVSFRLRLILYVATWIAVLIAIDVRLWALAYMLPLGIFSLLLPPGFASEAVEGWTLLVVGWLIYVVHGIFYFRARRPRAVWILYGALVLVLVCNVGGCREMLKGTGYGH